MAKRRVFPGVYAIVNIINGMTYIGSSRNIKNRCQSHYRELRQNKHYNARLQRSWNKYTEECFEFLVLDLCELKNTLVVEQHYIDMFPSHRLFNTAKYAGAPGKGRIVSATTRQKLSVALRKAKEGKTYPPTMLGKKHTPEALKKMKDFHAAEREANPHLYRRSRYKQAKWGSEEHREKLRRSATGNNPSLEVRKRMSESAKQRRHSEETKRKMTGRKLPETTKEKMRESQRIRRKQEAMACQENC